MHTIPEGIIRAENTVRLFDHSFTLHRSGSHPGRGLPLADYVVAIEAAEAFRARLDAAFAESDALLAPSAVGEAPEGLGSTGDPRFNTLWTLAWSPCLTLPAGTGKTGLPLGIQLVGPRFADEALLDTAAWVEARLG
jgi:Asp-tRNA(Asn)/Glu-tRNA(Gln) amidotransferase A subunit family amidase